MNKKLICLMALIACTAHAREQWSRQQANTWSGTTPWFVGANYIPANAINQLEMWQSQTFDPRTIDRELGWAQAIGMNAMRVFLHDLLWEQDSEGFKQRIDQFLQVADRHHIKILFVLFDSCWEPEPKLGPQHPPIPGVHNSGWVKSPAISALNNLNQEPRLEAYVKGVVGAFARDNRILGWDVWNEPAHDPRVVSLLEKAFGWARSVGPLQPLTSGVCCNGGWVKGQPDSLESAQLTQSEMISFHDYNWPEKMAAEITQLKTYGRPLLCTEYLARGAGSTFEGALPLGLRDRVAMLNWGLVDGKTQTRLPWDSWERPYVRSEPPVWHHDVLHADGVPYREAEVALIRRLTAESREHNGNLH
jgi:hypothetical protein